MKKKKLECHAAIVRGFRSIHVFVKMEQHYSVYAPQLRKRYLEHDRTCIKVKPYTHYTVLVNKRYKLIFQDNPRTLEPRYPKDLGTIHIDVVILNIFHQKYFHVFFNGLT